MTTLRAIQDDDLELIMKWRMSPEVTTYMNTDPKLTLDGQRKWLASLASNDSCRYWMILADGKRAGLINLADMNYETKITSWAYYIGEMDCRSMKLAISLEMGMYNYVFNVLGFEEVYGDVFSLNEWVIRLHKFCGAHIDHVDKNKIKKNGKSYDVTHVVIRKDEWEKVDGTFEYEKINFDV